MSGIGSTFTRLPRVAAWLAGAAMLAGALCPSAMAQSDETAMAVPRLAPFDSSGVALPQPLAAPDAAVLKRLFAQPGLPGAELQRRLAALDTTVRLNDEMLGHLLANRYLGSRSRATAAELSGWLSRYAALPDAAAIGTRLHQHDPAAVIPADLPSVQTPGAPVPEEIEPVGRSIARNPVLDETIRQRLHDGQFEAAERLIGRTRGLDAAYEATLRAELAQALFTQNRDRAALAQATLAVSRGQGAVGLADYVAGLASWRLGRPAVALTHFAAAAQAPVAAPALHAAGAYWASRASVATGDHARWRGWLNYAAAQHRTFYGQIARRVLGRSVGLAFADAVLGEADIDAVAAEPGGMRAFALLQLGQTARAEAELRLLAASMGNRPAVTRAVMLVAGRAGLFELAADLAAVMQEQTGQALDGDRFPVPRLRPRHGFLMDPALVYALTRIESNFDPEAVSSEGAQGLMQLMPQTAGYMAQGRPVLHDPGVNLDLGQRYVAYLSGHDAVGGDLIRLLASYNSGPAAFARWGDEIRHFDDPLLFIEAIPTDETRRFVQRALAFTWIYAARLHLPTPSLDALAADRFPRFTGAAAPAVVH